MEKEKIAILSGDVVGSSRLSSKARVELYELFPELSIQLKKRYPDHIPYAIDVFRGDSWQLLVNSPVIVLDVCVFIRTYFGFAIPERRCDTRIGIGLGTVDFIPDNNITAGNGEAFILSGHALEGLAEDRMAFAVSDGMNKDMTFITQGFIKLVDHKVTFWSSSQCQAIHLAMQQYRQKEIGDLWTPSKIKQSTVSNLLKRAGWNSIEFALKSFQKMMEKLPGVKADD